MLICHPYLLLSETSVSHFLNGLYCIFNLYKQHLVIYLIPFFLFVCLFVYSTDPSILLWTHLLKAFFGAALGGSLLLLGLFSSYGEQGLLSSCGARASHWWLLSLRSTASRARGLGGCGSPVQ